MKSLSQERLLLMSTEFFQLHKCVVPNNGILILQHRMSNVANAAQNVVKEQTHAKEVCA